MHPKYHGTPIKISLSTTNSSMYKQNSMHDLNHGGRYRAVLCVALECIYLPSIDGINTKLNLLMIIYI